jgi:hypothetical protein
MLRFDQSQLATAAGVSVETIKRLERLDESLATTKAGTLDAIQQAIEAAGVIFVQDDRGDGVVRLRKAP